MNTFNQFCDGNVTIGSFALDASQVNVDYVGVGFHENLGPEILYQRLFKELLSFLGTVFTEDGYEFQTLSLVKFGLNVLNGTREDNREQFKNMFLVSQLFWDL